MLVKESTVLLPLAIIVFLTGAVAHETRTLVSEGQFAGLPNASNKGFFTEQFPFQLLSPQFKNLMALLSNLTQSLNKPQSGQPRIEKRVIDPTPRKLDPVDFTLKPTNATYTTLPFNELNLTEFSWVWENLLSLNNSLSLETEAEEEPTSQERVKPEFQPRLFGGNSTADLNFLSLSQLFNLVGR